MFDEPAQFDLLIEADTVLPMTAGMPVITGDRGEGGGAVGICGDRIRFVGQRAALPAHVSALRHVRVPGGIVCPGFINLHAHLAHSLLPALGDGLAVQDWLERLIFPIERALVDEPFVTAGTTLGLAQMLACGVTLTVDMYYHEDAVAQVVDQTGCRAVLGQTVIGYPSPDALVPGEGLAHAAQQLAKWAGHPRVQMAVAPHATYTTDPELLGRSLLLARQHQCPLLIHLSEMREEITRINALYGRSPISYLHSLGAFDVPTVGAHVIYPQPGDLELLVKGQVGVAHCPQSNLHMGETAAPILEYLAHGVAVGLGTDGAGSAPGVDLVGEAALAGRLMKARAQRADAVRAADLLHMLTAGAAAALRRPDLGVLAPGLLADVTVFAPAGPIADQGLDDPFACIIYAARHREVVLTVVGGQVLYDHGGYPTIDLPALQQRVTEQTARVRQLLR